jgi:3-methyladenine DNA glycosylase AlkD
MAAYLKTDMPCYGVTGPGRKQVLREVKERHPLGSRRDVERLVRALWALPRREDKHLAVMAAALRPDLVGPASMPLYEKLIREGAWWDLVDFVAIGLVGAAWRAEPGTIAPIMDRWVDDDDLWIRRTAIIAQVSAKKATDWRRLFRYCRRRMGEREFFVRKAIGWALRSYSYTEPERVRRFLEANREKLSGLSFREGARVLRRRGIEIGGEGE